MKTIPDVLKSYLGISIWVGMNNILLSKCLGEQMENEDTENLCKK
jgi:hypothetical protein